MASANNMDPDEAPQKEEPHLRSKLFDAQVIISAHIMDGNNVDQDQGHPKTTCISEKYYSNLANGFVWFELGLTTQKGYTETWTSV